MKKSNFRNSAILFSILLMALAGCQSGQNQKKQAIPDIYELVWSDEFDYSGLPDSAKWRYDTEGNEAGWGNNEDQWYTASRLENAHVENGVLHVTARCEDFEGKKFTSARLISNADWKYGRFEIRAKVPEAVGTWPAIWMMPGGWSFNDGGWPGVGEIDIMEHVGFDPGVIHASAHSQDYQWQAGTQKTGTIMVPDAMNEFHVYTLDWSPEALKAYVNDSLFFEYQNEGLGSSKWPYDKPFYLILNVAVGGEWGRVKGIDDDAFPQTMEIDYVRVYQKREN